MDPIHIEVTGDRQVGLRFEEFPDDLYEGLRRKVEAFSNELFARVVASTPELTGLLRSEERVRLFTDPNRITGYVDIAAVKGSQDFAKAAALEWGAHASTAVKAHPMRLDHHWDQLLAEPETVLVADYNRTPDIAEHAFERGPLAEMQPEIIAGLNEVVEKSVAEVNG